MKTGMGKGR